MDNYNPTFLAEYVAHQRAWSERTFGPGARIVGITAHIEKECAEVRANPADLTEWIDILILALDGYWRAGGDPSELEWRLKAKQEVNFRRVWPAGVPEDRPVEHIKA